MNSLVTAAFLDLSKDFNSNNYDFLDIELGNLGFNESSKNLLRSFITNRRQSVILQDCISDEPMFQRSVPQRQYLARFDLICNTSKTEFMIFGKSKRKDFAEQIIMVSIPIDEKPEVKI